MIYSEATGRAYIGSSGDIYQRLSEHKAYLNGGTHSSPRLQNSYRARGGHRFKFLTVEVVSDARVPVLVKRENFYLLQCGRESAYNTMYPAQVEGINPGFRHSEETKAQMSETWRKKVEGGWIAPMKGRRLTDEQKAAISRSMTGRVHSEQAKARISKSNKGRPSRKVNEEQVRELRALCDDGTSQADLAVRFGITPQSVRNIVRGITWREVKRDTLP